MWILIIAYELLKPKANKKYHFSFVDLSTHMQSEYHYVIHYTKPM